jgi:hypothetical protein
MGIGLALLIAAMTVVAMMRSIAGCPFTGLERLRLGGLSDTP